MKNLNFNDIKSFIENSSAASKIYIGVDSERYRRGDIWFADFTRAVVIHKDGKHGCKVFGDVITERDYDQRKDRPATRLMSEVYKCSELYLQLAETIGDRYFELHLDINPDEQHGSS